MPLRQYRACVVDSLGVGITCALYHSSMCTRHPNLVSSAFYAIPVLHIIIWRIFNLLVLYGYGQHLSEIMMSVLQKLEGLTKELCFIIRPGGRPVSMQNFRLNVYTVTCFDIGIVCIIRTDKHHFIQVKEKLYAYALDRKKIS